MFCAKGALASGEESKSPSQLSKIFSNLAKGIKKINSLLVIKKKFWRILGVIFLVLISVVIFLLIKNWQEQDLKRQLAALPEVRTDAQPLVNPPKIIKAVYFSAASAGSSKRVDYLMQLLKETELNAAVIDLKDFGGYVAYNSGLSAVAKYITKKMIISRLDLLVRRLHRTGNYAIARIAIFQDPALAKARPDLAIKQGQQLWQDRKGLSWVDPAAIAVWDYNIALAQEAAALGFDEINFDYIRFPSDGNLITASYPVWNKQVPQSRVLKEFFQRLSQSLPQTKISADLFGYVLSRTDDFGVGQILEDALGNFDFVSPMVYPSHYPKGFLGLTNPAAQPGVVVKEAMTNGQKRLQAFFTEQPAAGRQTKLRPWLQDFDLGAVYDAAMVRAQIKATADSLGEEYSGFMLWNARNEYTAEALAK